MAGGQVETAVVQLIAKGEMELFLPGGTVLKCKAIIGIKLGSYVKFTYDHHNKRVHTVWRADQGDDTQSLPVLDHPEIMYDEDEMFQLSCDEECC